MYGAQDYCCATMSAQNFLWKKELKQEILKADVGMGRWSHWLTKCTSKESTFHNIVTFHTTIPTEVAVNIVLVYSMPLLATYVGMVV